MASERRERILDALWNTFNFGSRGHFNWVPPSEPKRQAELLERGSFDAGWHASTLHIYEGMCSVTDGELRFSEGARQFRYRVNDAQLGRRPIVDSPQRTKGGLRRKLYVQCGRRPSSFASRTG